MAANVYSVMEKFPVILRARGYRLYAQNGQRLIDLWLNGGAAILGHTPPDFLREIKNTASRGLYAPYPHFSKDRYLKALSKLFPQRSFRLYAAPPPELTALFNTGAVKIWRPFINHADPFAVSEEPILIPALPGIQLWRDGLPLGLCAAALKSEEYTAQLPQSDILPPVLLAAAVRGLYDLIASPQRGKPNLPRTLKAFRSQSFWKREGIYLTLKKEASLGEWEALFHRFLEAGFLLPPDPSFPLILPGELSDGEDAKLAVALGYT
ncbi:MAG: hypothetical protein FWC19_04725 [Treponema sp.]|nr:hypothetical protein [Treponema sp.]MCL2272093.1 hypothetical protein [Treponema sp.]